MEDTDATRPRRGRPRAEDAGEVDRRILDAATAVILENGYGRATMEQIADAARAGKTTLYSRYPTKADLFAAVVTRSNESFALEDRSPASGVALRERVITAGNEVADLTLTPESIALMRATSAESETFPDVAREGFRLGFENCARHVARALADDATEGAVDAAMPLAKRFVELALHPLYMHAFFGTDLAELRERSRACVIEVTDHLLATAAHS
ncbi:TetR/AcrR family transcriptional regulator [Rathayibacter sp. VKM Ac-2856]|uniref:TetR/AcrR family transcriptional regulator n=1 Tax=unclassified Rathayibacter TaxID=2609250 RepID=UPI001565E665|nr:MULTISPECIES: TetR/AcrR family transcriptional regulator [unclassified Rathayibacter]NQX03325.1 TetR/AcrR family transcriptional regulator [Rathayibacter sp. VKM Ac-2858]NQX18493.1 TetR/AcrR family transcriptional regulator [Rathayibacter sp. VKM Ac-2856]